MQVRNYMTSKVATMSPDDHLYDAVRLEMEHRIRHIPVVDGSGLVGIVTDRDLKRFQPSVLMSTDAAERASVLKDTRIGDIMTREPATIGPDAPLRDAVELMHTKKYGALPVVEGGRLVGIISETDLLRAFLELLDR